MSATTITSSGAGRRSALLGDPAAIGLLGTALVLAVLVAALNSGRVWRGVSTHQYQAVFAEAGGLQGGDEVRMAGLRVGRVVAVDLERDTVVVTFQVRRGARLGQDSHAAVKTLSALGNKYLAVQTAGAQRLAPGGRIPLQRTEAAFDLTRSLSDLTSTLQPLDTDGLGSALDTLADTFRGTPDELEQALSGVSALSRTIAERDAALREVLRRSAQVSTTLTSRQEQIQAIVLDGNRLVDDLVRQRATVERLFAVVSALTKELGRLIRDGRHTLRPALRELRALLTVLERNRTNLQLTLDRIGPFARSLGESLGSGPFFMAYVANLTPPNWPPSKPGGAR